MNQLIFDNIFNSKITLMYMYMHCTESIKYVLIVPCFTHAIFYNTIVYFTIQHESLNHHIIVGMSL